MIHSGPCACGAVTATRAALAARDGR